MLRYLLLDRSPLLFMLAKLFENLFSAFFDFESLLPFLLKLEPRSLHLQLFGSLHMFFIFPAQQALLELLFCLLFFAPIPESQDISFKRLVGSFHICQMITMFTYCPLQVFALNAQLYEPVTSRSLQISFYIAKATRSMVYLSCLSSMSLGPIAFSVSRRSWHGFSCAKPTTLSCGRNWHKLSTCTLSSFIRCLISFLLETLPVNSDECNVSFCLL